MSDIQRWYITNPPGQPTEFVTYADHVAAVTEEREQTRIRQGESYENGYKSGYEQGQRDERKRLVESAARGEFYLAGQRDALADAVAAVEALPAIAQHVDDDEMVRLVYDKGEVIEAIKGVGEVSE